MNRDCVRCGLVTVRGNRRYCETCLPLVMLAREGAGTLVSAAIKDGRLAPPSARACVDCGRTAEQYDHRDYFKPLKVDAVCRRCNLRRGPAYATWRHNTIAIIRRARKRRQKIIAMRVSGAAFSKIAGAFGFSRGRAHQLVKAAEREAATA